MTTPFIRLFYNVAIAALAVAGVTLVVWLASQSAFTMIFYSLLAVIAVAGLRLLALLFTSQNEP